MIDQHPLFTELNDLQLSAEWQEAGRQIVEQSQQTMVLGAPDSGKSTFSLWAAMECLKSGRKVAYIDSDMGQSHVGPPTTIGLEILRQDFTERERYIYFVGATNPKQHLLQTLTGVRMLADRARQLAVDRIIVDTTGLVHGGAARELKLQKVNLLQPDCLVAMQRGTEIEHLLGPHRDRAGAVVHRLPVSEHAKARKRDIRRNYRSERFRDYFAQAARVDIPLSQIWIQGRSYCSGKSLSSKECADLSKILGAKMVFGNRLQEEIFLVTNTPQTEESLEKARKHFGCNFIFHMPVASFRNLVVGLVDESGLARAIGLFFYLNLQEKIASIFTPLRDLQAIRMIQLGSLHISPNGKELDWH
jgi:polynucleotide 5'-hydroxyl-kinase GRC3/NOL9